MKPGNHFGVPTAHKIFPDACYAQGTAVVAVRLTSKGGSNAPGQRRENLQSCGWWPAGEETIRSHFKNVQAKLGARNRPHAVAEALRHHLIV